MDKLRFILLFAVMLLTGRATAYDFESGGLFYNILDKNAKTVELTCQNYTDWDTHSDYSGDVLVPAEVVYDNTTYKVVKIGQCAFKTSGVISVTISEGVESIGQVAFERCYELTSISLPSTLTEIEYGVFWNCNGLTSMTLPEGLTTIGNDAFRYCYSLKQLVLPSTLSSIGERAFCNTEALLYVISNIKVPFTINENTFAISRWSNELQKDIDSPTSATLYVPTGTSSDYKTAKGWSVFDNIIEGVPMEATVDGLTYSYSDGGDVAKVIAGNYSSMTSVTIPSQVTINGVTYNVKGIGNRAFENKDNLQSVIIQEGIETIDNNAFFDCDGLENIEIPSTLKRIGNSAFVYCRMKSLTLPEGLTSIGSSAFSSCVNLQKLVLPSTLTSLGESVINNCQSLSMVVSHITSPFEVTKNVFCNGTSYAGDTVTYIKSNATLYVPVGSKSSYDAIEGWNMFTEILEGDPKEAEINGLRYTYIESAKTAKVIAGNYTEMETVTIPGTVVIDGLAYSVKEICASAFYYCNRLMSVVIEDGIETIGKRAFDQCTRISSIQFPSTLKTIGDNAFQSCNGGPEIILPEGLEFVGDGAFHASYSQRVELPSTLKSIGQRAFTYLNGVVVSRIKEPFVINKNTFASDWYWENGEEVVIPSAAILYVPAGTTEKYQSTQGWNMFGDIMEGEPQVAVGEDGFKYSYTTDSKEAVLIRSDNYNFQNLSVPATTSISGATYSVVGIGTNAFGNSSIMSLKIANGIRSISKDAFRNCHSLRSASLPESIIKIGENAFYYCDRLDTVSIPAKVESIGREAFAGCRIKEIVIPATTTSIGNNAFRDCRQVTAIRVDAANSYYDSRNNCNALVETSTNKLLKACASTVIPNGVVEIENSAFSGLSNFTSISIPSSVTAIHSAAFNDCDGLTSIYIPSSVTVIDPNPFTNCDALATIKVDANNSRYDSRNDCNAIIEKTTSTLVSGCKNTVIPRGIKVIGASSFNCVSGLDSLKIPYGVQRIGDHAFSYSSIRYIEIPNTVNSIEYWAFGGCNELTTIVSKIKAPSTIDLNSSAFSGEYWNNGYYYRLTDVATLYVPRGVKELYSQAYTWNEFSNIEEMSGEPLATPTLSYDGRAVTAFAPEAGADMYYSTDGKEPSIYYEGPIAVSDLSTVKVFAEKSFRADSEIAEYQVKYLYDGDTLKLAEAGLMEDAIKWCGTDSVEKMTVVGPISSTEFETIRTLKNLKFLNLASAQISGLAIPDNAFANSNIVSFVAPSTIGSVGKSIFSGCQQLAAVNWDTDKALPSDALDGVDNPNLLLYLKSGSTAPAGINNVIVGGTAKKITLVDATGNNNFYCPVAFSADSIIYTRNFMQKTEVGVSRGWETLVLPFNVKTITHETNGTLTPFASYYGSDSQRPFWLYTLENNRVEAASSIKANVPYLICMPNCDEYGDNYNQAGNVKFAAAKVTIAESKPQEKTQYNITFTPAYQRVAASADVFALNVNQEYKGYPAGSLFVSNFREVRPFEAYSVHPSQAKAAGARMITVSSLIGGGDDTTGIIDIMLKKNDGKADADAVIKVYSLSGALVKQGRAEEVTKSLPKGIYIANGKKFVVK